MSVPADTYTPILTVNLQALADNYRLLRDLCAGECGATVKADGYGLGAIEVTERLIKEGCKRFFVATKSEALELRKSFPHITLYVFAGLGPDEEQDYLENNLHPVLNSITQLKRWAEVNPAPGAALHIDTAMNRLGLEVDQAREVANNKARIEQAGIDFIMTHLAFADNPDNPRNTEQQQKFADIAKLFPDLKTSIGNSGGLMMGQDYIGDIARPGIALYGGNPQPALPNKMNGVVTLTAPLLQTRQLKAGETVGYGGLYTSPKDQLIGTVGIGYADGMPREISDQAYMMLNGIKCPLIGRVSMDSVMINLDHFADNPPTEGTMVEWIGTTPIDQVANWADTISYNILTSMGGRIKKTYEG